MTDLLVQVKAYGVDPLTVDVLKQYLNDGAKINASISIDGDIITIAPSDNPGFYGLVEWLGAACTALLNIRRISTETLSKIDQARII